MRQEVSHLNRRAEVNAAEAKDEEKRVKLLLLYASLKPEHLESVAAEVALWGVG